MSNSSVSQRISNLHSQARDVITWLSIPGAAEKAGIGEPNFLILSMKCLVSSCTPEEAADDLESLLSFVKRQVQHG